MSIRAIALDVDGTVLDRHHRLAPRTAGAVQDALRAGVAVLLASARSPRGLRPLISRLGLSGPQIAFGGALVFNDDGAGEPCVLSEQRMRFEDARAAATVALSTGVEVGWYAGDRLEVRDSGPAIRREVGITGEPLEVNPGLPDGVDAPHKLLCLAPGRSLIARLEELQVRLPPALRGQFSHPTYLEVTDARTDKGVALTAAASALGLELAETAAIGDGANDIGMLRCAGVGVAMAHSPPDVIDAADWVATADPDGGLAEAIHRLLTTKARTKETE
jgi:Cof subfamily protein (haloacid dehalogenase superfamily)